MTLLWARGILLLAGLFSVAYCQDPCLPANHKTIKTDHWRSTAYTTPGAPYCDLTLSKGWYHFDSGAGTDLATSCPALLSCNTLYPVWTPDSLPTGNGIATLRMMKNNPFGAGCNDPLPSIRAKNCSSYNVYELQPILSCAAAYCIGSEQPCPGNTTSPNGFTPGCHVQNITVSTTLSPGEKRIPHAILPNTFNHQLIFNCSTVVTGANVSALTSGSRYELDVEMYASQIMIYSRSIALPATSVANVILERTNWTNFTSGPYLGHNMSCSARPVIVRNGNRQTWHWHNSNTFFAGIKVSPSSPNITEGHTLNLTIQSTVPITCPVLFGTSVPCQLKVFMEVPSFHARKKWSSCGNRSAIDLKLESSDCGVNIPGSSWSAPKIFQVKAELPSVSSAGNYFHVVRFSVAEQGHDDMYSNYTLPDVRVLINPARRLSGICAIYTDPWVRTFDGAGYGHQYTQSYLILQDSYNDIQIHGYFQSRTWWSVVCAIAIKSGGDVFVADYCYRAAGMYTASYPRVRMSMRGCSKGDMKITTTSRSFRVTLPTGMIVYGYYRSNFMNVHITPSALSIGRTVGLCGTFDGNRTNDFLRRDGVTLPTNRWNAASFSRSWALRKNESLFFGKFPRNLQTTNSFCECPTVSHTQTFSNVTCGTSTVLQPCYDSLTAKDKTELFLRQCNSSVNSNGRRKREIINVRRKRQVLGSVQSLSSDFEDEFADDFNPFVDTSYTVQAPQWHNGWTNASATAHCTAALSGSQSATALNISGIEREQYLDQCIMDIQTSGNTTFVSEMQYMLISDAQTLLLRDTSQWTNSSSGVLEPPFQTLAQLCPNTCSNQGTCTAGSCDCNAGYLGDDCSKSLSDPPEVLGSARDGICDVSNRPCQVFTIYGTDFNENSLGTCLVTEIQMDSNGTIISSSASRVTTREVETEYKAFCYKPQLQGRKKRSASTSGFTIQGYQIQSSNNGVKYSSNTTVLVIDTTCLDCNSTTSVCSLKPQTCSISGDCYLDGDAEISKPCRVCDSAVDPFDFTIDVNTCYIGSQCYNAGDNNTANACQMCDPSSAQQNWTGTTCQVSTGTTGLTTTLPSSTNVTAPTTAPTWSFTTAPASGPTTTPLSGSTSTLTSGPTTTSASGPTTTPTASRTTTPSTGPATTLASGPTTTAAAGPTATPPTSPTTASIIAGTAVTPITSVSGTSAPGNTTASTITKGKKAEHIGKRWWAFLLASIGITCIVIIVVCAVKKKNMAKRRLIHVRHDTKPAGTALPTPHKFAGPVPAASARLSIPRPSSKAEPRPHTATSLVLSMREDSTTITPLNHGVLRPGEKFSQFAAMKDDSFLG